MTEQIQIEQTEQTGMDFMLRNLSPANRKSVEHFMRHPNDNKAYALACRIALEFDRRNGMREAVGTTAVINHYMNADKQQRELQKRLSKKKATKLEFIDVSLLPPRRRVFGNLTRRVREQKRPRPQVFRRPRGEQQ